ncbi:TfoX/Sxy family protein [Ruminococcus sp.]|uniref:TfoX/Sxy family protein n=1 Tax=Ruminococcus sp. TaxID=41978 RepID=UPI0025E43A89|nr:TfoX/Sxy family protein [Ruminococcus sp.]MBO4523107.1 TfoX/Sxy family protein [Ruminococcus sp.]
MASSREYLEFVLEQLSEVGNISYRAMMGEFIIYCQGKVVGGIYDDRFLVKPTDSAKKLMPEAPYELPYEGGSKMLLVEDIDNRIFLRELLECMVEELPLSNRRKKT